MKIFNILLLFCLLVIVAHSFEICQGLKKKCFESCDTVECRKSCQQMNCEKDLEVLGKFLKKNPAKEFQRSILNAGKSSTLFKKERE